MLSASLSYKLIVRDLPATLERTGSRPDISREISYYRENIREVKSLQDFIADDRLFRFAMTAYGLQDMSYAKAFMRKVLESGIDSPNSLANRLQDPRYKEFATVFNFARYGETTTIFERAREGTIDRFVRQTVEIEAGAASEGARLALYFQRKAPEVVSAYNLLADRALLEVAQMVAGLPPASAALDIDKQAALISSRIDLKALKDPEQVQKMMERFTLLWEMRNQPQFGGGVPNVLVGSGFTGLSQSLLTSIQNLRPSRGR